MNRKAYLKDPYVPPTPFTGWDYVLSAVALLLIAIASAPQIAALIVHR